MSAPFLTEVRFVWSALLILILLVPRGIPILSDMQM